MKSEKEWDLWEKRITQEARLQSFFCAQFPPLIRGFHGAHPIKVKSSVDFAMGIDGRAIFFDAKVTKERVWNLKKFVFNEDKIHQYAQILMAASAGCTAGYLIWFSDHRKIVWLKASVIEKCYQNKVASIHPETEGVSVQSDEPIIDFKTLFWGASEPLKNNP